MFICKLDICSIKCLCVYNYYRASPFRFIVHQLEVGGGDALSSSPLVYNLGGCGLLLLG